ncbi:13501_t:CDS:2 [Acaulospora colombiana]|uniref:13501_t:CDS:1 n=1 Tax=Acaulospora colombiana TaxID=27376 RepID=A0ACA9NPT9_9GLOM|nr:13501_t:CDS:2 [Acaulospora colombiana]
METQDTMDNIPRVPFELSASGHCHPHSARVTLGAFTPSLVAKDVTRLMELRKNKCPVESEAFVYKNGVRNRFLLDQPESERVLTNSIFAAPAPIFGRDSNTLVARDSTQQLHLHARSESSYGVDLDMMEKRDLADEESFLELVARSPEPEPEPLPEPFPIEGGLDNVEERRWLGALFKIGKAIAKGVKAAKNAHHAKQHYNNHRHHKRSKAGWRKFKNAFKKGFKFISNVILRRDGQDAVVAAAAPLKARSIEEPELEVRSLEEPKLEVRSVEPELETRDVDEVVELEARDVEEPMELEARDVEEELQARDFDEELEARDFDDVELEARDVEEPMELEARDFDELETRDIEEEEF